MVEFRSISSWVQTPQPQVSQESMVIGRRLGGHQLAETEGGHSSPGHCFACHAHVLNNGVKGWFWDLSSLWLMKREWERHRDTGCPLRASTKEASSSALNSGEAPKSSACSLPMITPNREDWMETEGEENKPEDGYQSKLVAYGTHWSMHLGAAAEEVEVNCTKKESGGLHKAVCQGLPLPSKGSGHLASLSDSCSLFLSGCPSPWSLHSWCKGSGHCNTMSFLCLSQGIS